MSKKDDVLEDHVFGRLSGLIRERTPEDKIKWDLLMPLCGQQIGAALGIVAEHCGMNAARELASQFTNDGPFFGQLEEQFIKAGIQMPSGD